MFALRRSLSSVPLRRCCFSTTSGSRRAVALGHSVTSAPNRDDVTGPPLVCLHGLFGSRANFRSQGKLLSRELNRDIVLVDIRNHGSSTHSATMDYTSMAADVSALLETLGIDEAAIVGHSMGGKVAMNLALTQPDLVERVVSVDVAPVPYASMRVIQGVVAAMQRMPLDPRRIASRQDADEWLAADVPDVIMRQFILTNLILASNANPPRWRVNLDAIAANMPNIKGFDCPPGAKYQGRALFVYGTQTDYVVPELHGEAIKEMFPHARTVPFEAGHWLHSEKPKEFVQEVVRFVKET
eukprot:UC1_evm1s502